MMRLIEPGVWSDDSGTLHVDIDMVLTANGYEVNEQTRRMLIKAWMGLVEQGIPVEVIE
jgi:hypothetical protein